MSWLIHELTLAMIPDTFGDPDVLLALVLAVLPIVLYLLERRRAPRVDWPAMRFLLRGARRTLRRMRTLEQLLLAVRVLLIGGLVYAFARPATVDLQEVVATRQGSQGAVLLIDNSLSMGFRPGENEETLFDAVKTSARDIVAARVRDGDSVWIVTLADSPRSVSKQPFRTVREATAAVNALRLEPGRVSVLDAMDLAADLLATVASSERSIHILTDFDTNAWSLTERERWSFVLGRLDELKPPPLRRAVSPVASTTSPANRALLSLSTSRSLVGTDRPVDVIARALRFGEDSDGEIEISLAVDGEVVQRRRVSLAPEELAELRFPLRFERPGHYRLVARLERDALPFDDTRYLAVDVVERVPVLILTGAKRGEGDAFENGFAARIDLALAPHAGEETTPDVVFEPRTLLIEEAIESGALAAFCQILEDSRPLRRVIVLVDTFPDRDALTALERFVDAGGGLLVFASTARSTSAYNGIAAGRIAAGSIAGGPSLFPGRLSTRSTRDRSAEATTPDARLDAHRDHPALEPFQETDERSFDSIRVQRWNVIDVGEAGNATKKRKMAGETSIPMEIDGEAVLVAHERGKGRVLVSGLSGEPGLSDLADRPAFVPWIHGLVGYLASPSQARGIDLGSTLALDAGPATGEVPHVSLRQSDGTLTALPVAPRNGRYRSESSAGEAGFYTFFVRRAADEEEHLFAVNPSTEESRLRRLTESERKTLEEALRISVVTSDRTTEPTVTSPHRREHWPFLIALVLGLLIVESALTRGLARGFARIDDQDDNASRPPPGPSQGDVPEALAP